MYTVSQKPFEIFQFKLEKLIYFSRRQWTYILLYKLDNPQCLRKNMSWHYRAQCSALKILTFGFLISLTHQIQQLIPKLQIRIFKHLTNN